MGWLARKYCWNFDALENRVLPSFTPTDFLSIPHFNESLRNPETVAFRQTLQSQRLRSLERDMGTQESHRVVPGFSGRLSDSDLGDMEGEMTVGHEVNIVHEVDTRTEVHNTTDFPWRTIAQLTINYPDGAKSFCSGFLVDSFHVLTAGHCVYNVQRGGWADSIIVAPGQNGSERWFGQAHSVHLRTDPEWIQSEDTNSDWGLITLDRSIGDFTGWMGREVIPDLTEYEGLTMHTAGYPGDKSFPPYDMFTTDYESAYETETLVIHWLDTAGGQSGSPLWRVQGGERYVSAIHTFGEVPNHGTRLNQDKFDRLNTWIEEDQLERTPTDLPDLVDWGLWFGDFSYSSFTPGPVAEGDNFTVQTRIRNNGTASAGSFQVKFYASEDSVITPVDPLLGSVTVSSLDSFAWADVQVAGSFPDLPPGEYFIGWIIDSSDSQLESLETNNSYLLNQPTQVVSPTPDNADLIATSFAALPDHVLGGETTVSFTVQNIGQVDAGSFEGYVVLSRDNIIGNEDDAIVAGSTVLFNGLAAGASKSHSVSLQLDRGLLYQWAQTTNPTGKGVGFLSLEGETLGFIVDGNNEVAESDEGNNAIQGSGQDKDSITYFPWDLNGNGLVEPVDALAMVQRLGTSDPQGDFNGDGLVTMQEVLGTLERLGYQRHSDPLSIAYVMENTPEEVLSLPIGTLVSSPGLLESKTVLENGTRNFRKIVSRLLFGKMVDPRNNPSLLKPVDGEIPLFPSDRFSLRRNSK